MVESASPSYNQETRTANSEIWQSLKASQAQIGSFAKSLDSINSSRQEIDAALDGDKISVTAETEYQNLRTLIKIT